MEVVVQIPPVMAPLGPAFTQTPRCRTAQSTASQVQHSLTCFKGYNTLRIQEMGRSAGLHRRAERQPESKNRQDHRFCSQPHHRIAGHKGFRARQTKSAGHLARAIGSVKPKATGRQATSQLSCSWELLFHPCRLAGGLGYLQAQCSELERHIAGRPEPLGPSPQGIAGINFAVFSEHASSITLVLFKEDGSPWQEFDLDPKTHRTGNIWHAEVASCPLVSVATSKDSYHILKLSLAGHRAGLIITLRQSLSATMQAFTMQACSQTSKDLCCS